jgi:hypothetical protein
LIGNSFVITRAHVICYDVCYLIQKSLVVMMLSFPRLYLKGFRLLVCFISPASNSYLMARFTGIGFHIRMFLISTLVNSPPMTLRTSLALFESFGFNDCFSQVSISF